MLHKLTLGLMVLVLLAGCTGYALPETLSATRAEEDMPLADQQALAEFQLEASGEVAIEPAVPAKPEEITWTYEDLLPDELELIGDLPAMVPAPVEDVSQYVLEERTPIDDLLDERAMRTVPAPIEDVTDLYWEDFLPDEMEFVGERSAVEPAAPVKPAEVTWTYDDLLPDELELIGELPAMVPAPVEDIVPSHYEAYHFADMVGIEPDFSDVGAAIASPTDDMIRMEQHYEGQLIEETFGTQPVISTARIDAANLADEADYGEGAILRPALPTEGTWGPSYEDEFTFAAEDVAAEAEIPARFRDLPTTGTWGPNYEETFSADTGTWETDFGVEPAVPVRPEFSDEVWIEEGGVIIGYGPTDFKMPVPEKPIGYSEVPESLKGPFYYGHPFPGHPALEEFRYRVEDEPVQAAPAQPVRIPDNLQETNPIYFEWLMENK